MFISHFHLCFSTCFTSCCKMYVHKWRGEKWLLFIMRDGKANKYLITQTWKIPNDSVKQSGSTMESIPHFPRSFFQFPAEYSVCHNHGSTHFYSTNSEYWKTYFVSSMLETFPLAQCLAFSVFHIMGNTGHGCYIYSYF